jgi:hypothetical protein
MDRLQSVLESSNKRWWTGKEGFEYALSTTGEKHFKDRVASVLSELNPETDTYDAKAVTKEDM